MNVKMTKVQKFEMLASIPEVAENEMLVEFINREIELLQKKSGAEKKPTAQQVENQQIKSAILLAMEPELLYSVTEIQKLVPACAELSNQRVSALVKQMKEAGLLERVEEKRKAYFRLV